MTPEQHPIKSERLAALPPAEKAKFLFDRPTCPDRAWTDDCRLPGETRDAFIRRIVLCEIDNQRRQGTGRRTLRPAAAP